MKQAHCNNRPRHITLCARHSGAWITGLVLAGIASLASPVWGQSSWYNYPYNTNISVTSSGVGIGTSTFTPAQLFDINNGQTVLTGAVTLATAATGLFDAQATVTNNGNGQSSIRVRNTLNGNGNNATGVDVAPTFTPSASIAVARGSVIAAYFDPPTGVTITDAAGGQATTVYSDTSGAVTTGSAFEITSPYVAGSLVPGTQYGLHIENQGISGTPNAYGIYVESQSGSTNSYAAAFMGGNVGIGTASPQHTLGVNGSIGAQSITVASSGADYVFDTSYRLPSLSAVADYIKHNHHLPDMPSAAEMKEKGVDLGEMQTKVLAKVEELTLHMIELEQANKELKNENARLQDRLTHDDQQFTEQIQQIKERIGQ